MRFRNIQTPNFATMTSQEVKSLDETKTSEQTSLPLSPEAQDFLTSPYREALMTPFLIGSNKLLLYGQPFLMAGYSTLIKSVIPEVATSKPPHELLTFGLVLERPITALWLYLNGYMYMYRMEFLDLFELLHMYRICNYFGMEASALSVLSQITISKLADANTKQIDMILDENNKKSMESVLASSIGKDISSLSLSKSLGLYKSISYSNIGIQYVPVISTELLRKFVRSSVIDSKAVLADAKNVDIIASMFNQFFSNPDKIDWKNFIYFESEGYQPNEIRTGALNNIFEKVNQYLDIKKSINYIPVYITHTVETYAERKALANPRSLGRLNQGWKYEDSGVFFKNKGSDFVQLTVENWGPDEIDLDDYYNSRTSLDELKPIFI